MAGKKLSKIGYMNPVEQISRKFVPRHMTSRAANANGSKGIPVGPGYILPKVKWFGAAVQERKVAGYGTVTKNIFVCRQYGRESLPQASELMNRTYFAQAKKWSDLAFKDLMAQATNIQRWMDAIGDFNKRIQGVSAKGYQTTKGWYFAVAMALLNDGETLPADHVLPNFDA